MREGVTFDSIAHALATEDPTSPRLHWIQPAETPAPARGMDFYVANAGGDLRWCYVDPRGRLDATCDRPSSVHWPVTGGTASGIEPTSSAKVVAMLDHAVRIYEGPDVARQCTPAPASIVDSIRAPAWHDDEGFPTLQFVQEVRPLPDLARLVLVRARFGRTEREELWSWNPEAESR